MTVHRFRELVASPSRTIPAVETVTANGFVPCPGPLLQALPAGQHQFIQEIYRLAQQQVQEQLRRRNHRQPTFSAN